MSEKMQPPKPANDEKSSGVRPFRKRSTPREVIVYSAQDFVEEPARESRGEELPPALAHTAAAIEEACATNDREAAALVPPVARALREVLRRWELFYDEKSKEGRRALEGEHSADIAVLRREEGAGGAQAPGAERGEKETAGEEESTAGEFLGPYEEEVFRTVVKWVEWLRERATSVDESDISESVPLVFLLAKIDLMISVANQPPVAKQLAALWSLATKVREGIAQDIAFIHESSHYFGEDWRLAEARGAEYLLTSLIVLIAAAILGKYEEGRLSEAGVPEGAAASPHDALAQAAGSGDLSARLLADLDPDDPTNLFLSLLLLPPAEDGVAAEAGQRTISSEPRRGTPQGGEQIDPLIWLWRVADREVGEVEAALAQHELDDQEILKRREQLVALLRDLLSDHFSWSQSASPERGESTIPEWRIELIQRSQAALLRLSIGLRLLEEVVMEVGEEEEYELIHLQQTCPKVLVYWFNRCVLLREALVDSEPQQGA